MINDKTGWLQNSAVILALVTSALLLQPGGSFASDSVTRVFSGSLSGDSVHVRTPRAAWVSIADADAAAAAPILIADDERRERRKQRRAERKQRRAERRERRRERRAE